MFPQNENNTPFDNEALFDAEGHLTDEGLHALQEGRLDELGSLETAEHLTLSLIHIYQPPFGAQPRRYQRAGRCEL